MATQLLCSPGQLAKVTGEDSDTIRARVQRGELSGAIVVSGTTKRTFIEIDAAAAFYHIDEDRLREALSAN